MGLIHQGPLLNARLQTLQLGSAACLSRFDDGLGSGLGFYCFVLKFRV